jgi:hypothetical protein
MNSRREFREIVKMSREGSAQKSLLPKLFGALRLFILFFLFSSNGFGQNIQSQQYDINDPRNPNCPCHKLQKLADDEYERIQNDNNEQKQFAMNFSNLNKFDNNDNPQSQLLNVRNSNQVDNNGSDNSSHQAKRELNFKSRELSKSSGRSESRVKKRKSASGFYKKINRAKLKNSRIKKVRPNYAVCYKW